MTNTSPATPPSGQAKPSPLAGGSTAGGFTRGRLVALAGGMMSLWAAAVALCMLVPWWVPLTGETLRLRLYRLIPASVAGAALSVAGVALQSLLRNPLASPEILGISSGATVGAMLAMLAGSAVFIGVSGAGSITAAAAAGGVVTILVVYFIAQRRGRLDPYTLLLTGVIVTAFNGAIIMFLYRLAPPGVFREITFWSMGQVREQTEPELLVLAGTVVAMGWGVLLGRAKGFNVQSLGDDVAASAGVNVQALRLVSFGCVALMTAAAVTLAGPVAFVGLIVPHLTRRLLGADHRRLILAAGWVGATFLALADTLCRASAFWRVGELPVGLITAAAGGPFFLYLLRRRFRERI